MQIRIQSGEELNKLLDRLVHDAVDANIYHQLLMDLNSCVPEYTREFAQANTFWSLTREALKEAYLTRLCRIFDQHDDSLNLYNLLDTIMANLQYFEEPHFRERLKDNAFVNSLAEDARIPSAEELQADLEIAGLGNPVVLKLTQWRSNFHAHLAAKPALGKAPSLLSLRIESEEIDHLLDECFRILNRYIYLYKAASWSRRIIGHDDYLSVLKLMRQGIEVHDAEIERQIESLGLKIPPRPPNP